MFIIGDVRGGGVIADHTDHTADYSYFWLTFLHRPYRFGRDHISFCIFLESTDRVPSSDAPCDTCLFIYWKSDLEYSSVRRDRFIDDAGQRKEEDQKINIFPDIA